MNTRIPAMPSDPTSAPAPVLNPALAARSAQWVAMGVDRAELIGLLTSARSAPGTDAWANHFSAAGEAAAARAELLAHTAETAAERDEVRVAFEAASFWFFLARFPAPASPATQGAYQRSLEAALRAGAFEERPLIVVTAKYGEHTVTGHLRLPAVPGGLAPLVVLTGGIDVFKADIEIRDLANAFRNLGVATLAVDMPGTGESPVPARPGEEATYEALLRGIADDPALATEVTTDSVGVVGLSFGGHWAQRLMLTNPRITAAVSISGPAHHTFTPANIAAIPGATLAALAAAVGATQREPEAIQPLLAELSILDGAQGNLTAAAAKKPLLAITGGLDELVPVADATLLVDLGHPVDLLVYGTDRHVASNHWTEHVPFLAAWLSKRLLGRVASSLDRRLGISGEAQARDATASLIQRA